MNPIAEEILMHYGMPRRSGRYPWGSFRCCGRQWQGELRRRFGLSWGSSGLPYWLVLIQGPCAPKKQYAGDSYLCYKKKK